MGRAFKIYRIVCTLTGKSLVTGSDKAVWYGGRHPSGRPLQWHNRGSWSDSGAFWKTENSVRRHLRNLCQDWRDCSALSRFPRYAGQRDYWTRATRLVPDWSRLNYLQVEQIYVSSYATTTLRASDFMGIALPNDGGSSPSTHEATSSNGLTPDLPNEGSETNGLNPNQEQP